GVQLQEHGLLPRPPVGCGVGLAFDRRRERDCETGEERSRGKTKPSRAPHEAREATTGHEIWCYLPRDLCGFTGCGRRTALLGCCASDVPAPPGTPVPPAAATQELGKATGVHRPAGPERRRACCSACAGRHHLLEAVRAASCA